MDVTNENAPWDWGQGKNDTTGMRGKDGPAIHQAFYMDKQIEIKNNMSAFGKTLRGNFPRQKV